MEFDDKKLYKEFLNGQDESFEILINNYKSNIIYFIYGYVKNIEVAEDIFQEIALYIFSHREAFDFNYSFKAYVYLIAKSRALDYIKFQKVRDNYIENQRQIKIEENKLLDDIVIEKEFGEKVKKVLNKLKPDYKQVIYLAVIEDLSYNDIAKIMDKNIAQVKNLVHRAKKTLKKLLIKENVVEIKGSKLVKILSIIVVSAVLISGIGYSAYNWVSKKILKPGDNFTGINFSEKFNDYSQNYEEIVEKEEVKPYNKTEVKLISSMCDEGFITLEFEVDLDEKTREYLRLDKSVLTDKDLENMKNRSDWSSEEEKDKFIQKKKEKAGVNVVKVTPNVTDPYGTGIFVESLIIDGIESFHKGTFIQSNKLNDYQYQVFVMYFVPEEKLKNKTEFTLTLKNIALENGANVADAKDDGSGMVLISGGDNKKFLFVDNEFEVKLSKEKVLENSKVLKDLNLNSTLRDITKSVDEVIVSPVQTVVKIDTIITGVSLKRLTSAFIPKEDRIRILYYEVYNQDGEKIKPFISETKRHIKYSNGKEEDWGTGQIDTYKSFDNATLTLKDYIVIPTDEKTEKLIIKPYKTEGSSFNEDREYFEDIVIALK